MKSQHATCMRAGSLQSCPTLCDPMDLARQAPLSMGFSRQEYWSGLPCRPPGDLPDPRIESGSLVSPALAGGFFTPSATWEAPEITTVVFSTSGSFSFLPETPVLWADLSLLGEGAHSPSVLFSCSVMSDSLQPHGLQHTRLPCPSPTPRVYSNSRPSSW